MASADDELAYLSPSFDPSSLTMPKLRNVLMSHNISYPASAKKPQLVDIFNQNLKPKARKLLAARDRVRRTSRGITDMPSSLEGNSDGDNDEDIAGSMLPPPNRNISRRRKSRIGDRVSMETSTIESPAKTPASRKSSSKHARPSDTETDHEIESKGPPVRKPRNSKVEAQTKSRGSADGAVRPPMRGSAFSDENPFQSGSSPLAPDENRRKSAGIIKDRRKSSSSRRTTEGVPSSAKGQQDRVLVPTSRTFELPVSRLKQSTQGSRPNDGVEIGENFTPEEQLELVRERARNGEAESLLPRKKRPQTSSVIPRSAPWVIFIAVLGGYATWWRQEKLAVGYCGIGRPSLALLDMQIPGWASALQPTCEPCPQHAICFERMETKCEHDFILKTHPLSLGGLVPLPPTCEPDSEKVQRIKTVADRAVEELRERKAHAECGNLIDDEGKQIPVEIEVEKLKEKVAQKRRRGMGQAEFEDLWKGALGEIVGREEVSSSSVG